MTDKIIRSWLEMIDEEMNQHDDVWNDFISCTLTIPELVIPFDSGFGNPNGKPFTLWTKKRVYFPTEYDGSENVDSVSRDPDGVSTQHL